MSRLAARSAALALLLAAVPAIGAGHEVGLGVVGAGHEVVPGAVLPSDAPPGTTTGPGAGHGAGHGAESAGSAEVAPSDAPPGTTPGSASDEGDTWIDESHRYVERELLSGLVWDLDSYFGEERPKDEPAGSVVRWRTEWRADDRRHTGFRTSALADVRLPQAQRWISQTRLVFEGESTADPQRPYNESLGNPGFSPSLRAEQAHLELRQVLVKTPQTSFDAGAGIQLRILPDPFVQVRFRQHLDLGARFESRFGQTLFWRPRDGAGEASVLDFARPLASHTVARWNNGATLSQITSGLEWYTDLGVAQEIPALRAAVWVAGAVSGHTRPRGEVTGYRLYTRLRRDLWRRWLFVELEPELAWPLDPVLGRLRVFAATIRTEVLFDGRTRPPSVEPGADGE